MDDDHTQSYLNTEILVKVLQAAFFTLIAVYIGKIWYSYQFFKKRGIKTPEYKFFWGNFPQIVKNKNYSEVLRDWTKTYGKTYGYYEGHLPVLVTTDLEIIEEIFVKQYSNFSARKKIPFDLPDDDPHESVFSAKKAKWKRMRNILNPTFTASKLRQLNPLMKKCTDRLIKKLNENVDREINITQIFKRFTTDTIWNCAFGVDADALNKQDDSYFKKTEEVFQLTIDLNLPFYLGIYFHEVRYLFMIYLLLTSFIKMIFDAENVFPMFWIRKKIIEVFRKRLKEPNHNIRDYVQLLIEARDGEANHEHSSSNSDSSKLSEMHYQKKLTDQEIEMNLTLFLLAGYETTSTALSYMFYVLATHPEEQQRLIDEIEEHFPHDSNDIPDFDNVQKLEYLDMFMKETLRMYPIGNSAINRRCVNPTNLKGIDIPLDLSISVDVLSLHYDKDVWGPEDPNEFNPLRFSPERKRHPMAHMGFGQGPRNCIGMKFALFEAKVAVVNMLKNFEVHATSNTEKDFAFIEGGVRSPKNGVKVLFKKRNLN